MSNAPQFNTIEEILAELAEGKMVIIVDDEDRENEGDFLMVASKVRTEDINFMATYGRGLVCMPITAERCKQLDLPLMVALNNEDKNTWSSKEDPRKTKFGTFIRSTSIDELPQLWNVLIGDMSLIGPRPERPNFVAQFKNEIPNYMLRHKMKAGITGWAQINGWRGDTSLTKRIECDIYYIKHWSLWLDAKILFLTFVKGFINKNALLIQGF